MSNVQDVLESIIDYREILAVNADLIKFTHLEAGWRALWNISEIDLCLDFLLCIKLRPSFPPHPAKKPHQKKLLKRFPI